MRESPRCTPGPRELELALRSSPSAAAEFSEEVESTPQCLCGVWVGGKKEGRACLLLCMFFSLCLYKASNIALLKARSRPHTSIHVYPGAIDATQALRWLSP